MLKRVLAGVLIVIAAVVVWELVTFPDVAKLAEERPETTAFMELRKKQLRAAGNDDDLAWRWVPYERISPYLRRAVLVAEDNAFYDHEGFDVKAMREALQRNWERRSVTHGGSTITQQLAKNLYLSPSRNPLRKVREYFIARSLEKHLTKKRILEIYLNVVELGERVYGAEAAARHYFDKPASALTPSEAALLAGALPNPRRMNPGSPNKRLRARRQMILSRMKRWGHLAEREVLTERKPAAEKSEAEESTDTVTTETTPDEPPPSEPATGTVTPEPETTTSEPTTTAEPVPPTESAEPPPPEPPPTQTSTTATNGTQ